MRTVRLVNKWLYDQAPWKLKDDEHAAQRASIVRCGLECVYVCAHLLAPLLPNACRTICEQLNSPLVRLSDLSDDLVNLCSGVDIVKREVLFAKKDAEAVTGKQEEMIKSTKKAPAKHGKAKETDKTPA
jgi:methionyl-tRNA synthetase